MALLTAKSKARRPIAPRTLRATVASATTSNARAPIPPDPGLETLTSWQRRVFERAYHNRARYLSRRRDYRRCSREDFLAGYLAFASENRLAWAFQD